jgi:hypothetical protein
MLTAATTSNFTFKTSILKDPRLNYPKLRLEIIELAANMCTEAVGNDGLLPWLYSQAQRNSLPGGMVANAAGSKCQDQSSIFSPPLKFRMAVPTMLQ